MQLQHLLSITISILAYIIVSKPDPEFNHDPFIELYIPRPVFLMHTQCIKLDTEKGVLRANLVCRYCNSLTSAADRSDMRVSLTRAGAATLIDLSGADKKAEIFAAREEEKRPAVPFPPAFIRAGAGGGGGGERGFRFQSAACAATFSVALVSTADVTSARRRPPESLVLFSDVLSLRRSSRSERSRMTSSAQLHQVRPKQHTEVPMACDCPMDDSLRELSRHRKSSDIDTGCVRLIYPAREWHDGVGVDVRGTSKEFILDDLEFIECLRGGVSEDGRRVCYRRPYAYLMEGLLWARMGWVETELFVYDEAFFWKVIA
ncbi:hypothetical protein EVAR_81919_1 [Eumeta japonica]|uniref:Uncharacterized protein n=1 Tax=Eumeta variegata TaxID=151549 RepID=A0A4C1UXL2_EUMVA|nr:hypothetical protein EVAR_81919_1 [Eumeta japonica]